MNLPSTESLGQLSREFGPSYFLFHPSRLRQNWTEFLSAFQNHYANTRLAYSLKTNYMPAICSRVLKWHGMAEVVSELELDMALRFGFPGSEIIFNGPAKSQSSLKKAFLSSATVNADSDSEVCRILSIAASFPERLHRVGVRCAIDLPGTKSRFGIDVMSDAWRGAIERLDQTDNIEIAGLHCHFLPPERSPDAYRDIADRMVSLSDEVFRGSPPTTLNLGGGFFSRMPDQFRRNFTESIPTFEEYGEAIAATVARHWGETDGPQLILEPGMAIVADAFELVTQVEDIREVCGRRVAQVPASIYDIRPTKSTRNQPLSRINSTPPNLDEESTSSDIVGYTCMEDDVLHRGYNGTLREGDYLLFNNVGAYSFVLKPPFIRGALPIIEVNEQYQFSTVVRQGETLDDFLAPYAAKAGQHPESDIS